MRGIARRGRRSPKPKAVVAPAADPTLIHPQPAQTDPVAVLAQQVSASPDYQVINHLDELLASEETSVWLDK